MPISCEDELQIRSRLYADAFERHKAYCFLSKDEANPPHEASKKPKNIDHKIHF